MNRSNQRQPPSIDRSQQVECNHRGEAVYSLVSGRDKECSLNADTIMLKAIGQLSILLPLTATSLYEPGTSLNHHTSSSPSTCTGCVEFEKQTKASL